MFEIKAVVDKLVSNPNLLFDLVNTEHAAPLSLRHIENLPDLPGIYVVATTGAFSLERLDQIIYIGVATESIYEKWRNHPKMPLFQFFEKVAQDIQKEKYDNHDGYLGIFCWVNPFTDAELLITLEAKLISQLKPPCNS